jgi:hypothetical protein
MDVKDGDIPLVFGPTALCLDEPTTVRNPLGIEKTP